MPRLPRLSGKELAKIVEKFGFVHDHTTGSHIVYIKGSRRYLTTFVFCPKSDDFGAQVIRNIFILREAGAESHPSPGHQSLR